MSKIVSVETIGPNLQRRLEEMHLGDTIILVDAEGMPQALMVSLKPATRTTEADADWEARWETLARQVREAWQSDKSATKILSEIRR